MDDLSFLPLILISVDCFKAEIGVMADAFFAGTIAEINIVSALRITTPTITGHGMLVLKETLLLSATRPLDKILFPTAFNVIVIPSMPAPTPTGMPIKPSMNPSK